MTEKVLNPQVIFGGVEPAGLILENKQFSE